jgi:hypothetical protein
MNNQFVFKCDLKRINEDLIHVYVFKYYFRLFQLNIYFRI